MTENIYEPPKSPCLDVEEKELPRHFSLAIGLSYFSLGFIALSAFVGALRLFFIVWRQDFTNAKSIWALLIQCTVFAILATVIFGVRKRYNWARVAMLAFLLICLGLSTLVAIRNGLHPEVITGPYTPANEGERQGAELASFIMPYLTGMVELSVAWTLMFKPSIKGQFVR